MKLLVVLFGVGGFGQRRRPMGEGSGKGMCRATQKGDIRYDAPTPRTVDGRNKPDFSGMWMRANSGPPRGRGVRVGRALGRTAGQPRRGAGGTGCGRRAWSGDRAVARQLAARAAAASRSSQRQLVSRSTRKGRPWRPSLRPAPTWRAACRIRRGRRSSESSVWPLVLATTRTRCACRWGSCSSISSRSRDGSINCPM